MELWDAYDRDFKKIQVVTLVRGEVIGSYLIMQRDKRKHLGGMWEATAGGSALQGEEPAICAARELYEETGITSNAGKIIFFERTSVAHSSTPLFVNNSTLFN